MSLPVGKLPAELLESLLRRHPVTDPRVVVGPAVGEDAAVLDLGERYLVAKTDPVTFAGDEIGWYAVHVNANDIATTGATPHWFLATLLLPEADTHPDLVEEIFAQIAQATESLGVSLVGGHSEITHGLDRPIVSGVMLGTVERDRMVTTGGAQPGDTVLLTKGVPIEAVAIVARQREAELRRNGVTSSALLERCRRFLHDPGISVVEDARIAIRSGRVHAMHDPTEGGLATGLWELAQASKRRLEVDCSPAVLAEGRTLCQALGLDPLGAIASGALLLAVHPQDAGCIVKDLQAEGIPAYDLGQVVEGPVEVVDKPAGRLLPRPERDEIARLFE